MWPPKKSLHVHFCKRSAPFFAVKQRWALFLLGFRDFAQISRDFSQIFRDFARIFDKSQLLGMRSLQSQLLHHWFRLRSTAF